MERLRELSRAPHHHPNAVAEEIEAAIVALKQQRPNRGPKKLLELLRRRQPARVWPARSTLAAILKRHGLVRSPGRSRKAPPYEHPFARRDRPNAIWSADLKGWFRTGDGRRCDPLTITDNFSHYLLRCQAVEAPSFKSIQPVFVGAFHEYGLLQAIRTDNGPPFTSTTVGGLSRLSIWWLKLGITPECIELGKPAQNGRHERMHRTLKDEAIAPPEANRRRQQAAFDAFRPEFNHQRPHEALGQRFPEELYVPTLSAGDTANDLSRRYESPPGQNQGDISWKDHHVYLTSTLA